MTGAPRAHLVATAALSLALASWPASLAGQAAGAAPNAVTVSGRITDAGTGAGVRGALVTMGERGPRAIADSTGAFLLRGVSPGRQRLVVERFGYLTLDLQLEVTPTLPRLDLVMEPAPVPLSGIDVPVAVEVDLVGTIRDARTDAALPWAELLLTPDAVRTEARGASGRDGVFRLEDVTTGRYLMRVQLVGYVSQYVPVEVGAPPQPIELRLEPDSVVQRGLVTLNRDLKGRRNAYAGIATQYDAERLNTSGVASALDFVNYFTWATVVACEGDAIGSYCVLGRNGPIEPKVFIDELPVIAGLDVLRSYGPEEFYVIEVFGRGTIRAYTHAFVEQRARRPRLLLPEP